jgi:hypothetical protein
VKSQPPLGPGYLRSNIQLIDQTSAAFRKASITDDDTVLHIATYLESLLRPKNARKPDPCPHSQPQSLPATKASYVRHPAPPTADGSRSGTAGNVAAHTGPSASAGDTLSPFPNLGLIPSTTDLFYSGAKLNGSQPSDPAAFWKPHALDPSHPGFDREGLDAIAAAAAAQPQIDTAASSAPTSINMSAVAWPSNHSGADSQPDWSSAPNTNTWNANSTNAHNNTNSNNNHNNTNNNHNNTNNNHNNSNNNQNNNNNNNQFLFGGNVSIYLPLDVFA